MNWFARLRPKTIELDFGNFVATCEELGKLRSDNRRLQSELDTATKLSEELGKTLEGYKQEALRSLAIFKANGRYVTEVSAK